jgi:hypothetical protein
MSHIDLRRAEACDEIRHELQRLGIVLVQREPRSAHALRRKAALPLRQQASFAETGRRVDQRDTCSKNRGQPASQALASNESLSR